MSMLYLSLLPCTNAVFNFQVARCSQHLLHSNQSLPIWRGWTSFQSLTTLLFCTALSLTFKYDPFFFQCFYLVIWPIYISNHSCHHCTARSIFPFEHLWRLPSTSLCRVFRKTFAHFCFALTHQSFSLVYWNHIYIRVRHITALKPSTL